MAFVSSLTVNFNLLPSSKNGCSFLNTFELSIYSGSPEDLEFLETCKSQGILWHLKNVREKSGNFTTKLGEVREFYLCEMNIVEVFKIHSSGEQELIMPVHI